MNRTVRFQPSRRAAATGLALLALPLAGSLRAAAQDAAGYTVKRAFTVGETHDYDITVKTKVGDTGLGVNNLDVTLKLKVKETVKETRPDGSTQLVYAIPEQKMTTATGPKPTDTQETDLRLQLPDIVQVVSKAGRTTSVNFENNDAILAQNLASMVRVMLRTEDLFFPTAAVKVGDSWKVDDSYRGSDGKPVTWKGTANAVSVETVNGEQALKIHVVADESGVPDVTPHIDADANIRITDGRVLKVNGTVNDVSPQVKKLTLTLAEATADAAAPAAKPKP
jgi:hypothetical protein